MSELEIPTVVAWLVLGGIVAFFILLIWSMKRHRDPKLEVDCDAPIEELLPSLAGLTLGSVIDGNSVEVLENGAFFDALIEEIDKARSRRLMAMFGADWREPNRYDLILNMGKMRRDGARRVIIEAAQLEEYQPTPASSQAFNDLALGSRVHANLFASRDVRGSALEVRAEGGHVHVKGRVDEGMEYEVVRLVEILPGVIDVTTNVYSVPPEGLLRI